MFKRVLNFSSNRWTRKSWTDEWLRSLWWGEGAPQALPVIPVTNHMQGEDWNVRGCFLLGFVEFDISKVLIWTSQLSIGWQICWNEYKPGWWCFFCVGCFHLFLYLVGLYFETTVLRNSGEQFTINFLLSPLTWKIGVKNYEKSMLWLRKA